jgi:hypothetical protein
MAIKIALIFSTSVILIILFMFVFVSKFKISKFEISKFKIPEFSTVDNISIDQYKVLPIRRNIASSKTFITLESFFSENFIKNLKDKIKNQIKLNIENYINKDIASGTTKSKINSIKLEITEKYKNIDSSVPTFIKQDTFYKICDRDSTERCWHKVYGGWVGPDAIGFNDNMGDWFKITTKTSSSGV